MPPLFLFVFVTHMPFFAWKYWQTREVRFAATTFTFALLAITYALRLLAPDAAVDGIALYWYVRVPAWASAVISIGLLLRHHLSRMRAARR
jgi:hypothetical protein